jgi:hypothetical protein
MKVEIDDLSKEKRINNLRGDSTDVIFVLNPVIDGDVIDCKDMHDTDIHDKDIHDDNICLDIQNIEYSDINTAPSNTRTMSAFLVLNSMIGSGIFNQPYVFSKAGLGSAILLLSVSAVFIWLGVVP